MSLGFESSNLCYTSSRVLTCCWFHAGHKRCNLLFRARTHVIHAFFLTEFIPWSDGEVAPTSISPNTLSTTSTLTFQAPFVATVNLCSTVSEVYYAVHWRIQFHSEWMRNTMWIFWSLMVKCKGESCFLPAVSLSHESFSGTFDRFLLGPRFQICPVR